MLDPTILFDNLNTAIKSLPPIYHFIAAFLQIAMYAHLALGYKASFYRLRKWVRIYFAATYFTVVFYFFMKYQNTGYSVLDAFLPMYVIYYIHSLLVLQSRYLCTIKGCRDGLKKLFKFDTYGKADR